MPSDHSRFPAENGRQGRKGEVISWGGGGMQGFNKGIGFRVQGVGFRV